MQVVNNALRVLEEVAARQPVGVSALARELGMPKSTVQRCLGALRDAGWIRPAGGELQRWVVTTKLLALGRLAGSELSLRDVALPVMEELRRRTGETIHLMVPEGDTVVLIERLETAKPLRIVLPLGKGLPLHASANGKAVLAASSPEFIDRYIGAGLDRFTDTTIVDEAKLREELALIARRGYATNAGEWRSDIAAVAAPALRRPHRPIASLSISTPGARMSEDLRPEYGRLIAEAAAEITEAFRD